MFMKGKDSVLVLFVKQVKVAALDVQEYTLKPDIEKIADDVDGEDRSRPDKVINLYDLSLKCFNATADKLVTILDYDVTLDTNEQPQVDFGLQLKEIGGGTRQFALEECVIDDWEWAGGGRKDRSMLSIPIRGRYFKKLN
jgi:hypothetical protein